MAKAEVEMGSTVDESLRALLQGDLEEYPQRTGGLDDHGWDAFGELVGAAFQRAVTQRFSTAADAGIPEFVAAACAKYASTAVAADPSSGEALVRSALGDDTGVGDVLARYDEPDLARIELVLLRTLIADAGLTGEAFDRFLADTGVDARPWSQQTDAESSAGPAHSASDGHPGAHPQLADGSVPYQAPDPTQPH